MHNQFFRLVPVALAAILAVGTANAQLGRQTAPPASTSASSATPTPQREEKQAEPATQVAPGLTTPQVQEMINNAIANLPTTDTDAITAQVTEQVRGEMPSHDGWHYGLLVLFVALAVLLFLVYRRIPSWNRIIVTIHDIVDPAVKNSAAATRVMIKNLAGVAKVPMEIVDPEGAKADRIVELKQSIAQAEKDQTAFLSARQFAAAQRVEEELARLRIELSSLQPEPRTRMIHRGGSILAALFVSVLVASSAVAAPTCWNSETGKTPGSQKVAVAIVGVDNSFSCAINGTKIELVDSDAPGTVVLTPTVIKTSPVEFTFKPTSEGRLLVKVDGRLYNQLAVRAEATAVAINDAIDLSAASRPTGSTADMVAREFIRGLVDAACEGGTQCNRDEVLKAVFGPQKGSSRQAGYVIGVATRKGAVAEAKTALGKTIEEAKVALDKVTNSVPDEAAVRGWASDEATKVVEPLKSDVAKLTVTVGEHTTAIEGIRKDVTGVRSDLDVVRAEAARLREVLAAKGSRGIKKELKKDSAGPATPPAKAEKKAAFKAADKPTPPPKVQSL